MTEATQRIPTSIKPEREERLEKFRDEMEDVWVEYRWSNTISATKPLIER